MTTTVKRYPSAPGSQALLLFGMLGGPVAWASRLLIAYPLVLPACGTSRQFILHIPTVVAALIAIAAGIVSWRIWQQARRDVRHDQRGDGEAWSRNQFSGIYGVLSSVYFLTVILIEGSMVFFVDACLWT